MREWRAMDAGTVPDGPNSGPLDLRTYVGALAILAAALAATWVQWYGLWPSPGVLVATAVLACFALLGDALSVRVSGQAEVGTWDIALVLAVAAVGPSWAALAAVPAALFVGGRDGLRSAYEVAKSVCIVYPAGVAFYAVSEPLLLGGGANPAAVFYGTLAAGVTLIAANEAINCGMFWVKYRQPLRETWEEVMRPYLASDAANVLTAALGALALIVYGPVAAVVVVAGAVISRTLVDRSRGQGAKIREQGERIESLERALTASNTAFGTMIVFRVGTQERLHPPSRGGHCRLRSRLDPGDGSGRDPRRTTANGRAPARCRTLRPTGRVVASHRQAQFRRPASSRRAPGARGEGHSRSAGVPGDGFVGEVAPREAGRQGLPGQAERSLDTARGEDTLRRPGLRGFNPGRAEPTRSRTRQGA